MTRRPPAASLAFVLRFWRRLDLDGLERFELQHEAGRVVATGVLVCAEPPGFALEHRWRLTPDWRTVSLELAQHGPHGRVALRVERDGDGWRVDGRPRPDLRGADEPDVSATPFCNSLPIRRLPQDAGATMTLDTCYVDAATMTVERSTQRYERLAANRVRYVDLGVAAGFTAVLDLDDAGLVSSYEGLFAVVTPA